MMEEIQSVTQANRVIFEAINLNMEKKKQDK